MKKTVATSAFTRKSPTLSFDCLTFQQADTTLCIFACEAKQLWQITQVNQLEENIEKGYQRVVSEQRAGKIAEFIDRGNFIPTSVLISFEHASLSPDKKQLIVKNRKDAGWVIDGQHRLVGASKADSSIVLPVVAFIDLAVKGQINCFVTINKEAKGVSSSLYLELLKNLPGKRDAAVDARERAVDLAKMMRIDEESPFFGRIVTTTAPRGGELSLTNFVRKVQPLLKANTGALAGYSDDDRCKILNSYYKALRQVFPAEFKNLSQCIFFKTIGFGVMMGVFPTVIHLTTHASGGFRVAHIVKTLTAISDFNFEPWRGMTGSGAENAITDDLRASIVARAGGGGASMPIELDD